MSQRESLGKTFQVATFLCLICSLVVSAAAVTLKPLQQRNKVIEQQKNVLKVAGIIGPKDRPSGSEVREAFTEKVELRILDFETDSFAENEEELIAEKWDQRKATDDPEQSVEIPADAKAGIKRRENKSYVYLADSGDGKRLILPVRGQGLWSTMYGYLALDETGKKVTGITFYEHAETPGLGGEVDNQKWKDSWEGKVVIEDQEVVLRVVKGSVNPNDPNSDHQIDGLSGATITSRGVENMIHYWLGEDAYGPFLEKYREGKI